MVRAKNKQHNRGKHAHALFRPFMQCIYDTKKHRSWKNPSPLSSLPTRDHMLLPASMGSTE